MLGHLYEGIQRFPQWSIPLAIVNQVGVFEGDLLLVVQCFPVQAKLFQRLVRFDQNGTTRCFVDTVALHTNQPILDEVSTPDPVATAHFVERLDQ